MIAYAVDARWGLFAGAKTRGAVIRCGICGVATPTQIEKADHLREQHRADVIARYIDGHRFYEWWVP